MKVLLIEDSARKEERLIRFFQRRYPQCLLKIGRSYQSGLRLIKAQSFDLILLDMTLPTYDATPSSRFGRPRPLGGYEIMRKMDREGIMSSVIVVTQLEHFGQGDQQYTFDQVKKMCLEDFPKTFCGAVFFGQSDSHWEGELMALIEKGAA
jgi:CheY-like chemotaxis protein